MNKWFAVHPTETGQIASIRKLREQLLNPLLISGTILGTVLLFLALIPAFQKGLTALTVIYTTIYVWLLIITIVRRTPYVLRAGSMLLFLYALGILNLATSGLNIDAGLFFLAFITMTALLIGLRAGIGVLLLSGITITSFAYFVVGGNIQLDLGLSQKNPMLWIIGGTILLMIGLILMISVMVLIQGLQSNLSNSIELTKELEQEQVTLRQRTLDLEHRSFQIRTAGDITRVISAFLDPKRLPQKVADLLRERFNLYYVGVFLHDEHKNFAILHAGTGEIGQKMISENYKVAIGESSVVGRAIAHREPQIVHNDEASAAQSDPVDLPLFRSEVAIPIISSDQVLGALYIQSNEATAFDEGDVAVYQGISDMLAIALENARLFEESERSLSELRTTQRSYTAGAWLEAAQDHIDYEFIADSGMSTKEGEGSAINVPLILREQIIGQINMEGQQDWTPEERTLIEAVATQAALAMENARLLEESRQTALRERLAAEITGKVWSSPNTELILQTAIKELGRALHADEATIELKMD
jgi:GAF domain-containing protein